MLSYKQKPKELSTSTRLAGALASAILAIFPVTIGYYLLRFNVWGWLPGLILFWVYVLVAMAGSAVLAFIAFKTVKYLCSKSGGV
ncbi:MULTISPECIES: hypothetical protein [Pseudomonas syringae group]|uniref:Uncharacterized protein n=1 Tax=Pseudomonas syringae pv. persicae TaxID=237306 RepID=A0A3M3ZV91_9PSED|nr:MULTISPECIES: hypothetical protein [Pseudomonas syringae group]QOQ33539.1 hypothetical protein [Pseudomonas syringae pv. actinidiae]RMO97704.1 hypothetical protein ALQ30_200220 [Pseudomonas syringae pv. persicae]